MNRENLNKLNEISQEEGVENVLEYVAELAMCAIAYLRDRNKELSASTIAARKLLKARRYNAAKACLDDESDPALMANEGD